MPHRKIHPIFDNQPTKQYSELTYDNKFSYDFCSCCVDCKLCCCGTFCLPCMIWSLYMDAQEGCCAGCWQFFTVFIPLNFFCSNMSFLRTKLRSTYKLHGSILEDMFYTSCCPCCSAIQMKLELQNQGIID
ncbi:placenta-specific protein 8 -like [Brachionus plicatilis]|uniref:Placenta-specific protein 8-like n=1 Tax=Brachionus plicatilis TaxID=10195 RepID=A0A3M7RHR5_BRAPC|nr:placenta-specific protein 8 -like [Brachionus plicatilis]